MRVVVVVGLLAGCSGSHPSTIDAPAGHHDAASHDAASHDAAPDVVDAPTRGPIQVTVYGDSVDAPQAHLVQGANVFFVEPNGTVTTVTTGMDGVATAMEPNNTTVWIVHRDSSLSYYIETYEGALIGDALIGGDPTPLPPDTVIGQAYIAFSSFSDTPSYSLTLSCTAGYTPSSASPIAPNFVACPYEGAATAVVTATDTAGNFAYTTATGINLAAHTSSATALALPAFQAGSTVGITLTNLPATLGQSSFDLRARYMLGGDQTLLQDVELRGGTLTSTATMSGSIAPVGDRTQVIGQAVLGTNQYTYDVNAPIASRVSSVSIDATTFVHPSKMWHYDAPSKTLSWFQDTFGVDPTLVQSNLSWNTGSNVAWRLVAPYAGGPVLVLPPVPPALMSVLPSPADARFEQIDLTAYSGKSYHDALVGQAGGAASTHIGVGP